MAVGISALILNYGASARDLRRCVDSLLVSRGLERHDAKLQEIVIADNASPTNRAVPHEIASRSSSVSSGAGVPPIPVRVLPLARNWGFAGGINRGVAALDTTSSWVFLLNNDAVVEDTCLAEAIAVASGQSPTCVAVAPKMLLAQHPHHLDGMGNCVNERGEAFNVGIGQIDIGQYDEIERCFGPCFGAALIRREAFDPANVGPLDESLFLYYEDVDWNWRANLYGYHAVTAPAARVHHELSGSTRHLEYGFKFRLQERNLLLVSAKNFETRRAAGIWRRRIAGHVRGAVTSHYPVASLRASAGALSRLPNIKRARDSVQARRVRTDLQIVAYSTGEVPFMDPVTYEPEVSLAALGFAYRRRAGLRGDPTAAAIAEMCSSLESVAKRSLDDDIVTKRLGPLIAGEPIHVREYVEVLRSSLRQ